MKTYAGDHDRPGELQAALADFKPNVILDFVCNALAQDAEILDERILAAWRRALGSMRLD